MITNKSFVTRRTVTSRKKRALSTIYMSDYVAQLDLVLTSGNRKLLTDSGKVSHGKAIKKAREEYRKYQAVTLTPVEEEYLKSLKETAKEVKKKDQ